VSPVGVEVFDGHGGGDAPQAAGQDLVDLALQLVEVGGQEALHCGLHRFVGGADADQSDGFDVDRNAVVGQRILKIDADVERFERHDVDPLDARHPEACAAADHFWLTAAGEDGNLVRWHLDVVLHVDDRKHRTRLPSASTNETSPQPPVHRG